MARKGKIGLDYFPHDTDFDNELEYLIAIHKEMGYYVYFRLLERLYSVYGYYYPADKKSLALLSGKINVDINKINDIINDCLSEHLFDKSLHNKYQILTSRGIQKRYFEAINRRLEVQIITEYILIDNEYINKLNVNIIQLNVDKSTQSKVKESKVKESSYNEFLEIFNQITGKQFRGTDKDMRQFNARIKEGFTLQDFEVAITNCKNDEYHRNNPKYLTPEFITRADKLQKFYNIKIWKGVPT